MNPQSIWRGLKIVVMMSAGVGVIYRWNNFKILWRHWEVYADFFLASLGFPAEKQKHKHQRKYCAHDCAFRKTIWPMARKLEYRLEWRTTLNRSLSPQLRMNTILLSLGIDWGTFFRQIKARTRRGRRLIIVLDSSYAIPMRWFVFVYNPVLCILSGELLSAQLVGGN